MIPKFCFDCYKIQIKPRNVVELFKLMVLFNQIKLPDDNTRKCYIEIRPQIAGSYSGLIYYQNLQEAKEAINGINTAVATQIAPNIAVQLKRGCSEFPLSYPDYGIFDDHNNPIMHYNEQWKAKEDYFDQNNLAEDCKFSGHSTHHQNNYTQKDCRVMVNWVRYAATIGDSTFRDITKSSVARLPDLDRPNFIAYNQS
ncbi:MAG: hypothetical protein V3V22_00890 [Methylococcales bacterium]